MGSLISETSMYCQISFAEVVVGSLISKTSMYCQISFAEVVVGDACLESTLQA